MRWTLSRKVRAIGAIGPLVCVAWIGAFAAFTDSVDVTSRFSTGEVIIEANDGRGTVAFTSLSMSGMTPGTTRYALLKISNAGSVAFDYSMQTSTGGDAPLAAALTIGAKVVPDATCTQGTYDGSSDVAIAEAAGIGAAEIAPRPLGRAEAELLCFKVALPSAADESLQGRSADATFTFTAES